MKIYVASSWRNELYPTVVTMLRQDGHDVYDFREANSAFRWQEVDPDWELWRPAQFRIALEGEICAKAFANDMEALVTADCVVLVLPSGRSAHLEAGYAAGQAKPVVVVCEKGTKIEPELMYLLLDSFETNFDHFMERVRELAKESPA